MHVQPEGARPFDEVKQEVTTRATLEAKLDKQAQRLQQALAQGFNGLAQRVGGQAETATLSAARGFDVPGFGPQPVLGGALLGLAAGQTTPVVRGQDAVFVARVVSASKAVMPRGDARVACARASPQAARPVSTGIARAASHVTNEGRGDLKPAPCAISCPRSRAGPAPGPTLSSIPWPPRASPPFPREICCLVTPRITAAKRAGAL
jgi:hypothetical protein